MAEKMIFTIGRQFGSGGRKVGKLLSERLGIPYYDKELLAIAAKDSGFSESGRYPSSDNPEYKASGGWALLGFLIPLVGLILYLVWRDKNRADAAKGRKAGKGALAGVIVWAVISILSFVIGLL